MWQESPCSTVIPAKAGIQCTGTQPSSLILDSRLRGNDAESTVLFNPAA